MKLLNSRLDYLKRALNQQERTYVYTSKAFLWIWGQSSEANYATLLTHFFSQ